MSCTCVARGQAGVCAARAVGERAAQAVFDEDNYQSCESQDGGDVFVAAAAFYCAATWECFGSR